LHGEGEVLPRKDHAAHEMTIKEFDALVATLLSRAEAVRNAKRPSYTVNSTDVLANFKRVGLRLALDPHKVLSVYQLKQMDGVDTRHTFPEIPASEPDLDRYADIINYALLDFAMLVEKQNETKRVYTGPSEPAVTRV
jgi:hypothetical protein